MPNFSALAYNRAKLEVKLKSNPGFRGTAVFSNGSYQDDQ